MSEKQDNVSFILENGVTMEELERLSERDGIPISEIAAALRNMISRGVNVKDEMEAEATQTVFDSFGFYSIPTLTAAERKPPEFIVSGMIPCGLTFISGAPKIRKSFFALQMAAAVATGNKFLGHDTTPCDVAYLDLEGSKSRSAFRADRMSIAVPGNVYITNSIEARLADGLVDKLRELHRHCPDIRLIIIDTYSRARGSYKSGGANAYDADVSLLEPVQRMAIEENIAVVFVHHDKKGAGLASDSFERLSGTMGISGSADAVLTLVADGKRFEGRATLEYTPRDARGGEKKLYFDEVCNEWQEFVETPVDVRGNPVCGWIIDHAPDKGCAGDFHSYQSAFKGMYGCQNEDCGNLIRTAVMTHKADLFNEYSIAVQLGVKSHGERGIRIINVM